MTCVTETVLKCVTETVLSKYKYIYTYILHRHVLLRLF